MCGGGLSIADKVRYQGDSHLHREPRKVFRLLIDVADDFEVIRLRGIPRPLQGNRPDIDGFESARIAEENPQAWTQLHRSGDRRTAVSQGDFDIAFRVRVTVHRAREHPLEPSGALPEPV